MSADQERILLSESEAARLLGLCPKTIYSLRKSGQLPFVQIGKSVRYALDSLREFVKSLEQRNTPGVA